MKKMNNKGFSLVELIIVIAIMAILAGAIAPALIKYIDKSRRGTDVSNGNTFVTAVQAALGNEDANNCAVGAEYKYGGKTVAAGSTLYADKWVALDTIVNTNAGKDPFADLVVDSLSPVPTAKFKKFWSTKDPDYYIFFDSKTGEFAVAIAGTTVDTGIKASNQSSVIDVGSTKSASAAASGYYQIYPVVDTVYN